jgi:hypothetical protein
MGGAHLLRFQLATRVLILASVAGCHGARTVPTSSAGASDTDPGPEIISKAAARYGLEQSADPSPPPLSGGTLIISRDDRLAIASDPDRDRVWIADIQRGAFVGVLALENGDEPGRLAEDDARHVHVLNRRSGTIATIDLDAPAVVERRTTCAEPRGIAFDPATGLLHVACLSGQLLSYTTLGALPVRRLQLEDDLRDIVIEGSDLWISRFRAAEVLIVGPAGDVVRKVTLPIFHDKIRHLDFAPSVAYRMAPHPNGGVLVIHQRATLDEVAIDGPSGGYAGASPCSTKTVHATITRITESGPNAPPPYLNLVVGVDVAMSPNGFLAIAASPGRTNGHQAFEFQLADGLPEQAVCGSGEYLFHSDTADKGEITAVAFDSKGTAIVQSREPAAIHVTAVVPSADGTSTIPFQGRIPFPGAKSVADFGHAVFHRDAGGGVACASCHPEGREDGRTWRFSTIGDRRTQSLRIGLLGTAPYHWDGNFVDLDALTGEIFTKRMSGIDLDANQTSLLVGWLMSVPPLARDPAPDPTAADRGRALFFDASIGCATCHSGSKYTNNATLDVGTGGSFQVPSLIGVGARAPYLHNGCASTLRDRFDPACGGRFHGETSQLSAGEIDDLVAFLETL